MHVVLPKAFIIPCKFMSHIPISYVGKDAASPIELIIIWITSEFASLFVPNVRFFASVRCVGVWQ